MQCSASRLKWSWADIVLRLNYASYLLVRLFVGHVRAISLHRCAILRNTSREPESVAVAASRRHSTADALYLLGWSSGISRVMRPPLTVFG